VTFQAPGEVRIDDVPEPELLASDDAIVRVEASGICGSDLHIYHGRGQIEPGFVIGHEYVGHVVAARDDVTPGSGGDPVLGTYGTACGECFFCRREEFHKCDEARVFGHGKALGSLQGAQAELLLVPHANLTLRKVPDGLSDDVALFAGDVMGTAFHAIHSRPLAEGESAAILGLGPVGLCAVQAAKAAGAAEVIAIDMVEDRLRMAQSFGATPVHLTEQDPRAEVKRLTDGRGVELAVEAVGNPDALDLALRLARKAGTVSGTGVYAEPAQVHMGLLRIKAITRTSGHAHVIKHPDAVLELLAAGKLDPSPLVTHHVKLDEAPDAYRAYEARQALKIVLTP